jgi:hypothetical protein
MASRSWRPNKTSLFKKNPNKNKSEWSMRRP